MKIIGFALILSALYAPLAGARMLPSQGVAAAELAMPQPPADNPHPPQSAEDKRRVDFAVQEIRAYYGPNVEIRHPHIIPWSWDNFQRNRKTPPPPPNDHSDPNVIIEAQTAQMEPPASSQKMAAGAMEPMPAPQLKFDEYMVHAYVRFPQDPRWHHLDVILTEDSSGKLTRRNFFTIPMPSRPSQLPPGVVC